MVILRDKLEELKLFFNRKEFIAITGPRQAGKTTFLEIIRDYLVKELKVKENLIHIITFEDRRLLKEFEDDPVFFVQSYMANIKGQITYLMIDEFQYANKGGQKLKLVYDTLQDIKIIITGSSSLEINAQVGKYLVGRILTFHLYPFNFQEYLRVKNTRLEKVYKNKHNLIINWLYKGQAFKQKQGEDAYYDEIIKYYENYCIWGGYPAVVLSKNDAERYKILGDILNGYILKDIKGLLSLATDRNLLVLSQYLATQVGNIAVYNNLGQASMLDFRRLKNHLNILKETFICTEVRPFFANRQKELSKNPKIFFFDTGFRNYLVENMNSLEKREDAGSIVENSVFIRNYELTDNISRINFWRTKAGAEVDFILHSKGEIIPLEVKFSGFEGAKLSKSFISFIDSFKPRKGIILTKNYWGVLKRNGTEIVFAPVYYL